MQQFERRLVRILQDQIERTIPNAPEQALELCEELYRFAAEQEEEPLEADVGYFKGKAYTALRKYELALANFEQALQVYRKHKRHAGRSQVLNSMGAVYQLKHERVTAIRHYHAALQAAREAGDAELQFKPLFNLAQVLQAQRNFPQALSFAEKAIKVARASEVQENLDRLYHMSAKLYEMAKDYDTAYKRALTAAEIAQQEDHVSLYASASHLLAMLEVARGNLPAAEKLFSALLDYQRSHALRSAESISAIELVKIWFKLRKHTQAFNLLIDQIGKIRKDPKAYPPESFVVFKLVGDYCRYVQNNMEAANRYYTMYLQLTRGVWKTYLTD
ncbi:MAG: tetratricopeptide repeat protein [Spirochaetota bacterium]